jgi:hypothetical protein
MNMNAMYTCIQCGSEVPESVLEVGRRENAPGQYVWPETCCPSCGGLCIPSAEYRQVITPEELLALRVRDIDTTPAEDLVNVLPFGCTDCQFKSLSVKDGKATIVCHHPRHADRNTAELTMDEFDAADGNRDVLFHCPLGL